METTIQNLFPTGTVTGNEQDGFGVINLPTGTVPQNCDILGTTAWGQDQREFYLVESGNYGVYLRIANAEIGAGYDRVVNIHTIKSKQDEDYAEFIEDKLNAIALALSLSREQLDALRIKHRPIKLG